MTQRNSRPVQSVRVINIVDGDTVDVVPANARRGGEVTRVRLWGIDAPESDQPLGPEATRALSELLRGGRGTLRMETFAYDRYARAIGLLYYDRYGRGRSVNRIMVQQGYAYTLRFPQGQYMRQALGLDAAEDEARRKRLGVWRLNADERETPWAYRSRQAQYNRSRNEPSGCLLVFSVPAIAALLMLIAAWR